MEIGLLKGVGRNMDNMNIKSGFMTGVISMMIRKMVKSKLGYDVEIKLNEIDATVIDGKTHVHLDIDAEVNKDEFMKLIRKAGF